VSTDLQASARRQREIVAWVLVLTFAVLGAFAGWGWHCESVNVESAHQRGRELGERKGYEDGYKTGFDDGSLAGRKQACRAFCAVEGDLGLFDDGGCFCVGPKQGRQILDDAVEEGLLELTPGERAKLHGRVQ